LGAGYTDYWNFSDKKGYAGTAVFSKVKPESVRLGLGKAEHDEEGRVVTLEFAGFFLVNSYVPNAGQRLVRLAYRTGEWDKDFLAYLKDLETRKPVVWCGDLNVAHNEIDIANPSSNRKSAGFTNEERGNFTTLLNAGFVDTFRKSHPDTVQYTFWSYKKEARTKNIGWRLDYFVVSERMYPDISASFVRPNVFGSDHCPIGILIPKDKGYL